jgi:hypothetical protein
MKNFKPERLSLGELVTWGDGYATGIIVGCYQLKFVGISDHDEEGYMQVKKLTGLDPRLILEEENENDYGYLILVNGVTGGTDMFQTRPFDTEESIMLNHGHADVRIAHEVKR